MKKKYLLIAVILALVLVCLAACDGSNNTLSEISSLLKSNYSNVTINVTTETSDVTLNGVFDLIFNGDTTTVDYSYDKLNSLSMDGNNANSFKTMVKGRAVVSGNNVTVDGETLPLELGLNFAGLNFKQGFFTNVSTTSNSFKAKVKNPKGFTGNDDLVCTDMSVEVVFTASSLTKITITYVSSVGADVTVAYQFAK